MGTLSQNKKIIAIAYQRRLCKEIIHTHDDYIPYNYIDQVEAKIRKRGIKRLMRLNKMKLRTRIKNVRLLRTKDLDIALIFQALFPIPETPPSDSSSPSSY